jgi:hypothetical protein
MAKQNKASPETQREAQQIARGIQRPGQSKEETKRIAQGIKQGIDLYKKQQKAKARELDRKRKKLDQQAASDKTQVEVSVETVYRQHWLPWALLVLSWIGMAGYCLWVNG